MGNDEDDAEGDPKDETKIAMNMLIGDKGRNVLVYLSSPTATTIRLKA